MVLNNTLLDKLTRLAIESPRLRINYNLHCSFEDSVQRLLNAIEPGAIIPISRHPNCSETLILLRGCLQVIIYDNDRNPIETCILDNVSGNKGFHIEKGKWHNVKSIESGTVVFEVREGPYRPASIDDLL